MARVVGKTIRNTLRFYPRKCSLPPDYELYSDFEFVSVSCFVFSALSPEEVSTLSMMNLACTDVHFLIFWTDKE